MTNLSPVLSAEKEDWATKLFDSQRESNTLFAQRNEALRGRVRRIKSALGFFVPRMGKNFGWKHPMLIEN